MNKRLLKVALTTALTVAFAVPAFANPFSDVPAKHWAYDAVNKLAQAGVVEGYSDGTFKGDKTMTRYEMAQIVANAMTKNLNSDEQKTVDQLSKEFATELNSLGVKVDGLQNQVDNMVKISGDARVRYGNIDNGNSNSDYRARVTFDGKISDNLKFNARLSSGNMDWYGNGNMVLDTANVSFNALGLDNTIGRQYVNLGNTYLFDDKLNGFSTNINGMKLVYGNTKTTKDDVTDKHKIFGAEYGFNALGANVVADFYKDDANTDKEIYGAAANFGLADNVTGIASYYKDNNSSDTAAAYGVKFNKLGLTAQYRDVEAGAFTGGFSSLGTDVNALDATNGFKGMEYQLDKNLDKNTVLTVKYQDFQDQSGVAMGARTSAVVNVKF